MENPSCVHISYAEWSSDTGGCRRSWKNLYMMWVSFFALTFVLIFVKVRSEVANAIDDSGEIGNKIKYSKVLSCEISCVVIFLCKASS